MDKYDPPNSAVVWIVWLIGQLTVSVLLLTLSGFHFGLVKPDLCDFYNATEASNNMTIRGTPVCEFSIAVLVLATLACIVSIVDATMNFHYLMHKVYDKSAKENAPALPQDRENIPPPNGPAAANNQEANCKDGEKRLTSSCSLKFPSNILRVWYCWILVHVILIIIAANTYKWPWETDDLQVLVNTAMFFLIIIVYLLLAIAMMMWHGCCYSYCCQSWIEDTAPTDQTKCGKEQLAPLLTLGLIISNAVCMAAALVEFFYPETEHLSRTVGLVMVVVHVIATSTIWGILLIYLYQDPDECTCKSVCFVILSCIIMFLGIIAFILVLIMVTTKPHNSNWPLFFLIPLFVWILSILFCYVVHVMCTSRAYAALTIIYMYIYSNIS